MTENEQTVDELMASLEGRIARLQKYLPTEKPKPEKRQPKIESPFSSKCPHCQGETEVCKGTIGNGSESAAWSWPYAIGSALGVGLVILCMVFLSCFFLPRANQSESGVLSIRDFRRSCRCKSCGFVGLEPAKLRPC